MNIQQSAITPCARLCHLKKVTYFDGYGFNLHNDKSRVGHFIGKVDSGSPAELAGLRYGDRVVEVNATNVNNENHQQVIERIKAVPNETKLLVVDQAADEFFNTNKMVISGTMPNIIYGITPESNNLDVYAAVVRKKHPDSEAAGNHFVWPSNITPPRLCLLRKWQDQLGFGFSLNAEKGKSGQNIGQIDRHSPAEAGGLQEGDKLLAVNGEIVELMQHDQVVLRIKANELETRLLVARPETDVYMKMNLIPISEHIPFLVRIDCPVKNPFANGHTAFAGLGIHQHDMQDGERSESEHSNSYTNSPSSLQRSNNIDANIGLERSTSATFAGSSQQGDAFSGSVAEARERMRRKNDVKNSKLSMREKVEIYKKL